MAAPKAAALPLGDAPSGLSNTEPEKGIDKELSGGAERDRTADLVIANDALSQLSYGPVPSGRM